jgi:BirA family transcriptional regulator, biotin operon repressor / biotin---[acetyl-CoA-carboxylase] ligase
MQLINEIKIGEPLIRLQSVDSTNTYAAHLLSSDTATEGTVILADHQTQGRGQVGNRWESAVGSNLLCSIIIKPGFLWAEKQFYISMSVANALIDLISTLDMPSKIKWPNDILIQEKKVAGILIENSTKGKNIFTSIIGIGLNVNQELFPQDLPNPVSLKIAGSRDFDREVILTGLLKSLNTSFDKLYRQQYGELRHSYLNNLWRLNEWAGYNDFSGRFEGRIIDVADSGELMVVRRGGEMKTYAHKEIEFS